MIRAERKFKVRTYRALKRNFILVFTNESYINQKLYQEFQSFTNGISFKINQRSYGPYLDDCWNVYRNNVGLSYLRSGLAFKFE